MTCKIILKIFIKKNYQLKQQLDKSRNYIQVLRSHSEASSRIEQQKDQLIKEKDKKIFNMEIQYRESPQIELNSKSKKSIERVKVVIHKWSNVNNFTAIKTNLRISHIR